MSHRFTTAAALAAVIAAAAGPAAAQTVVTRARLGHAVEDLTANGKDVIALDGFEVFRFKANAVERVLDVRDIGVRTHVTGLAWLDSEKRYAFLSPQFPEELVLADAQGRAAGTRAIGYLGGFVPDHTEGLSFLPRGTPWPEHLAIVAYASLASNASRIEIVSPGGVGVQSIAVQPPLDERFVASVAPLGDSELLVTALPNELWVIDYAGNVVSGPVVNHDSFNTEGLAVTKDGRVATVDYVSGKVFWFDGALDRTPALDRRNDFARLRTVRTGGVAWDPHRLRFHAVGNDAVPDAVSFPIFAVASDLDDGFVLSQPAICQNYLRARGLTQLPDEDRIAVVNAFPQRIVLYDGAGRFVEEVDLQAALALPGTVRPQALEYLPATQQFAVRFAGDASVQLRILERDGTAAGAIDFGALGFAGVGGMAYFDPGHPSGGQILALVDGLRAARVDLDGNLLATYDLEASLGILTPADLAYLENGPYAGSFAVSESSNAEIVVFDLP